MCISADVIALEEKSYSEVKYTQRIGTCTVGTYRINCMYIRRRAITLRERVVRR